MQREYQRQSADREILNGGARLKRMHVRSRKEGVIYGMSCYRIFQGTNGLEVNWKTKVAINDDRKSKSTEYHHRSA